ncbi:MAG: hypothetical protein V1799_14780 [bacterium]
MGSSKVILTGAISLIIGIYSIGIKRAEKNAFMTVAQRGAIVQLEQNARAGVQLIIDDLSYAWRDGTPSRNRIIRGDTLSYQKISYSSGSSAKYSITVSGVNGIKYYATAYFEFVDSRVWIWLLGWSDRERWKLTRVYGYAQTP